MKIIFPAVKDYMLSLIFANVDILESRREQLTAVLQTDRVSYGNRPAYITCFRTNGTHLSQTDYATQNIQANADES